ncbi:hypothetical protein G5B00_12895 [Parapedobacter sp. SGR-10]|uniref:hypothetical protein n=1 Tax=Parapedobacter sp. SGR-10 TaxID=2710879 RepID=UPI0013D03C4A|nr:hypothetical protein [Parapedobacter sp. SGR-10]NGF57408.1 hypothetical protein [Parapedobacter sp. SGR-10]
MKKFLNNIYWIILACIFCTNSFAQQIQARIEATQNGWQVIAVPQEFRARIGHDTGMLRIKDQKGNDVPYLVKTEGSETTDFRPVVYNRQLNTVDSTEIIVVDNIHKQEKQNYVFKIANTTAHKTYTIEGSNDQQVWFNLVSQGYIDGLYDERQTFTMKSIGFPRTDYSYIRITFDNKSSSPINILDIGEWETQAVPASYEKLRNTSFQLENDKKTKTTVLSLSKDYYSPVDFFQIHIATPPPYHREAEVFTIAQSRKSKHIRTRAYLTLHPENKHGDTVDPILDPNFYIRIFNEDNPPLQIDSVSLFQKPIQLIVGLKKGFTYSLEADTTWNTPNYDLRKAELQLPDTLAEVTIKSIEILESTKPETKNKYGNLILIICSVIGVVIVFYFGNSLLRDMKKK